MFYTDALALVVRLAKERCDQRNFSAIGIQPTTQQLAETQTQRDAIEIVETMAFHSAPKGETK